jgi:hypothetical protein
LGKGGQSTFAALRLALPLVLVLALPLVLVLALPLVLVLVLVAVAVGASEGASASDVDARPLLTDFHHDTGTSLLSHWQHLPALCRGWTAEASLCNASRTHGLLLVRVPRSLFASCLPRAHV